jgi:putative integral membrane protein (TIGR02587 family)
VTSTDHGPWERELLDLVRAASGGLLFGVPLLYTMEVWWTGQHTSPEQMLLVLLLLSIPVLALNRTAGFRAKRDVLLRDAAADTVETIAVGIAVTFVVLVLLRQVTLDSSLTSTLGTVVYESVPFCLGVGLARHFLQGRRGGSGDDAGSGSDLADSPPDTALHPTLSDLAATSLGAVFVALSIAPTDEVPMIAAATSPAWLLGLIAGSLASSYGIVFVAGFRDQERRHNQEGAFQHPVTETVVSYLVALAMAGLLLWSFQRGVDPPEDLLARTIVLGFPAAIGGAAGRLAV